MTAKSGPRVRVPPSPPLFMDLSHLFQEEKESLNNFFGETLSFNLPEISEENFKKFSNFGFDLHYLPKIEITESNDFPSCKEKPNKSFFDLIKKEKLSTSSAFLPGKWVFIEKKRKPKKNFWWIAKDDPSVKILRNFFRVDLKKYCQKISRQQYDDDFLLSILKENGFASRFSLSWQEIEEIIKPEIAKLLKIPTEKIRLPKFIEWNFLGNLFYPQWGKTSTWEWFADRLSTGECLAGGAGSLTALGWDPPDFWSTILGFRILIEI